MQRIYKGLVKKIFSVDVYILFAIACIVAAISTFYCFNHNTILAYGDAESHINIAKRVTAGITPGLAQLGGVWLPLPHVLMIPFVLFDPLWKTGIAGSIVGGISFAVSAVFLYKLASFLFHSRGAGVVAFLIFVTNPNLLYIQSTPLSECPLVAFFILSSYYFFRFLYQEKNMLYLIFAAFFGLCASLCRYDGWFLVGFESIILFLYYLPQKKNWSRMEGKLVLFGTLAFFGISLWFLWDFLILGDAFYFTNSPFSAKSQQQGWLARGELPTYNNPWLSFLYYFVTSFHNIGIWITIVALLGLLVFLLRKQKAKFFIVILMLVPFIFYWSTLYMGQSIIYIPDLTPTYFQWRLFNVRYGIMMIPFAALFFAYLFSKVNFVAKSLLLIVFCAQLFIFQTGMEKVITLDDGLQGLSAQKKIDADIWMQQHYTGGYVLLDDYARTLSIIKSDLPINKVIYVGNKIYWKESLETPQKYATWVVIQKHDAIWNAVYDDPVKKGILFKYFQKAYTSPDILIFKRNTTVIADTKSQS